MEKVQHLPCNFPTTNKSIRLIETPDTKQDTGVNSLRIQVDNEEAIRGIRDKFLSRSSHDVKAVDNRADAINMIEDEVFDLVLCDLAMPNVFGYVAVKGLNGLKNHLIKYADYHFAAEEKEMLKHDYPDYMKHRYKYQKMMDKTKALNRKLQSRKKASTHDVSTFYESTGPTSISQERTRKAIATGRIDTTKKRFSTSSLSNFIFKPRRIVSIFPHTAFLSDCGPAIHTTKKYGLDVSVYHTTSKVDSIISNQNPLLIQQLLL